MQKNTKAIIEGVIAAILIAIAIGFVRTVLTSSWEQGAAPNQVNIIIPDNKPKPVRTNRENTPYKPIELNDYDKNDEVVNINIEPLEEFSGLSVNEILKMRTEAVKSSPLFVNRTDYEPSQNVFRIEDGLQWMSAHQLSCYGTNNNPDIGKGPSRESVGILNPELMFYNSVLGFNFSERNIACTKDDYLLPYKANYTPANNTIHVYLRYKPLKEKLGYFGNIDISDANAHDLGYNYVFADSTSNIRFKVDKFDKEIIKTRGYYHRGYACGLQEGCNNYSPYETGYEFYLTDLPAKLHIKLWNQEPATTMQEADLNYEMIFE